MGVIKKQARGKLARRKQAKGNLARGKQAKGKRAKRKEKARRKTRRGKTASHKLTVKRSQERLMHRKSKNQSTINFGALTCQWNKYWRSVLKGKSRTDLPSLSASNDYSKENSKFWILKHTLIHVLICVLVDWFN